MVADIVKYITSPWHKFLLDTSLNLVKKKTKKNSIIRGISCLFCECIFFFFTSATSW